MDDEPIVPPKPGADKDVENWGKVDPSAVEDLLPQPYRSIVELFDEILDEVNDKIDIFEGQRKSEEYESGMLSFNATASVPVAGRITCACSEAKVGNNYMAVGTNSGEVVLIEMSSKGPKVVSQKGIFAGAEYVNCVALSTEGSFQRPPLPKLPFIDSDELAFNRPEIPRKGNKLFAIGEKTPKIYVYDIQKDTFGVELVPNCYIEVPPPPESEDKDKPIPPVEQLHVQGTSNGSIWVLTLLPDRSVCAYLVPLAEKITGDAKDGKHGNVADQTIKEADEDEEEDDGQGDHQSGDEFKNALQITTAVYRFQLPEMSPLAGFPEPTLSEVMLSLMITRPEGNKGIGQVPAYCFVAATSSNALCAYSLRGQAPPTAPAGLTYDQLLKEAAPPLSEVKQPEQSITLCPHRRWTLSSRVSCMASSVGGGILAVGGEHGALALISLGAGPGLTATLEGHYSAVVALGFHRDLTLVSMGADSWVHHYCMKTNTIINRHLCTPPPTPPPGQAMVVATSMPAALTLDAGGNLRLLDTRQGRKVARATCPQDDPAAPSAPPGETWQKRVSYLEITPQDGNGPGAPRAGPRERLRLVAAGGSFCVLREENRNAPPAAEGAGGDGAAVGASASPGDEADDGADPVSPVGEEFSTLFFFDTVKAPNAPKAEIKKKGVVELADMAEVQTLPPDSMAGTKKSMMERSMSNTSSDKIVALTTENLKRLGSTGLVTRQTSFEQATAVTGQTGLPGQKQPVARPGAVPQRAHQVPETWTSHVRKNLREGMLDKGLRNARLNKRMDLLRKDLEDAPPVKLTR